MSEGVSGDYETFMSSLESAHAARSERGLQSKRFRTAGFDATIHVEDLVTLVYAARMVNDVAVSDNELAEIFDAVRSVERELGTLYAFDQSYAVPHPFNDD
jgi:hypothetical protein